MNIKDMTTGSPAKLILAFALPIFAGSLFQQLYNIADTMIVGHVLGDSALAAVGATGPIYSLIIVFINGVCSGFSITISKCFGAGEEEKLKRAAAIAVALGLALTVVMTLVGLGLSMPLLRLLKTPEEIIRQSHQYISVLYAFMIFTMLYNLSAGLLRALGNSLMPLVFLVVAVVLNIGLDVLFVYTMGMGVAGAALATVAAQMISAVLCLLYILKRVPILHFGRRHVTFDRHLMKDMSLMGLSIGLSYSVVDLGTVALQGAVNSFGVHTITAHTAARRIIQMTMLPLVTLGTAAATFISQNLGAGKLDRIRKGITGAVKLSFAWSTLMVALIFLAGAPMVAALTGTRNPEIISTASLYLNIHVPFYYALGLLFIYRQALQGMGNKIVPVVSSGIELAGKCLITFLVVPFLGYLGVCVTEPVIWVACTAVLMILFYSDSRIRPREAIHNGILGFFRQLREAK